MTAVNAVFPIVLLILLGYFLRQRGLFSVGFVKTGNAVAFKVFLPVMLFLNVYEIESVTAVNWDAVLFCAAAVTVLFLAGPLVAALATKDPGRKGVIWQSAFRSNYTIIGISLSAMLGGAEAAAFSSIVATLVVPMFNIFAVIALSVYNGDEAGRKPSPGRILLDIVKNPLIIAVAIGAVCLGIRGLENLLFGETVFTLREDLKFLYSALGSLKTMATPFALVVLGGQFQFSVVKGMFREIAVGTVFRLVIAPVLGLGAALLLDRFGGFSLCSPVTVPGMLCLFGSPVAVSSAVMASQMGNDEQLAAQLVVWSSIGSMVSVFGFVCLLMAGGFLAV